MTKNQMISLSLQLTLPPHPAPLATSLYPFITPGPAAGHQIDGPARPAWTLPYIVSVNEEYPFGLSVAFPRQFDGEREDDRLKWYATTTNKDIILSAEVTGWVACLPPAINAALHW